MSNLGWNHAESPFHQGEIAIQERVGVRDSIEQQGRRFMRDYLLPQHRLFFAQLPFVLVGTVDSQGQPWASILVGEPGFLFSPDEHTLQSTSRPLFGDPLAQTLVEGADMGLLGIELHTRRRNRLNGVVVASDAMGFSLQVGQSFGNCPMYIQARTVEFVTDFTTPSPPSISTTLGEAEQLIVSNADTFFIATAFQGEAAGRAKGVDVSHRGGKVGFVRVEDERTLTIPDFTGNFQFNTLGNLWLNPRAGLLFIDFKQGDLLYMTGTAEIIWQGAELQAFVGAERLLRFHLTEVRRVVGGLPLRWSSPTFSPYLERTGSWTNSET